MVKQCSDMCLKVAEYFKTMFKKWSARVHQWVNQGSPGRQTGVTRGSARGQVGVSKGSARGQPGFTRGSARGHHSPGGQPSVSQGSARGQPGVIGIFSYDHKLSTIVEFVKATFTGLAVSILSFFNDSINFANCSIELVFGILGKSNITIFPNGVKYYLSE